MPRYSVEITGARCFRILLKESLSGPSPPFFLRNRVRSFVDSEDPVANFYREGYLSREPTVGESRGSGGSRNDARHRRRPLNRLTDARNEPRKYRVPCTEPTMRIPSSGARAYVGARNQAPRLYRALRCVASSRVASRTRAAFLSRVDRRERVQASSDSRVLNHRTGVERSL